MILVELNGGLGNQLFQYSAAKSLALSKSTELKLDISYNKNQNKPFELSYFNIPDTIATEKELEKANKLGIGTRLADKIKPNFKRPIYREPFFHFDNNFYNTSSEVYLKGLRQSEKYFVIHQKEIKKILAIKENFISHLNEITSTIISNNSISIHIRRGDYLSKIALKVLGLMPLEYYLKSLNIITTNIPNPHFYIFSDDIKWAKSNLKINSPITFVSDDITKKSIEDFYLMSQCKHNIIANSSFSWWAAWLNPNPDKIIIAPKKWFNKGPQDTQDLFPTSWIQLD